MLIHVKCSARCLAHSRCSINGSSYLSEGTKGRVSKGRTLAAGLELASWFFHWQVWCQPHVYSSGGLSILLWALALAGGGPRPWRQGVEELETKLHP